MSSLQASPEWSSTAVFVTWDDCGCFSDHVNPATYSGGQPWGIRVPVIVASPYVKAGYTDSHPTTFVGMLAYAEKTFGVKALGTSDSTAYDYSGAFCYKPATAGCTNVGSAATVHMITTPASAMTARQKQLSAASAKDDT
jgi:phospholipase C